MEKTEEKKRAFSTIAEKNAAMERILNSIKDKNSFLLLGHTGVDEDCIAALVSMAIVLTKFGKSPVIYMAERIPDQLLYLANICAYNKIPVLHDSAGITGQPDVVCILDTPKLSMLSADEKIRSFFSGALVLEIDHHLQADATTCGQPGYCYVNRASSTCELLAGICYKLNRRTALLKKYHIEEFLTRNLALCLLTGIIGDTKLGSTLKTNREKFFYRYFTQYFTRILIKSYRKNSGNYTDIEDIFSTVQQFSAEEKEIHQELLAFSHFSKQTGAIFLTEPQSADFLQKHSGQTFVKVIKTVTDFLAERSGKIGVTAYYDSPYAGGKIQYRLRAAPGCTAVDFRKILETFRITDGGGHPGAVGFRLDSGKFSAEQIREFQYQLIRTLDAL